MDDSGTGRLLFFSSGQRLELRATSINGVPYTFVASRQSGGGWLIEEVGGSATTGSTTTPTTAPEVGDVVASGGFSDVEGTTHEEAINALAAEGVFEGTECEPDTFCPRDAVERWVMAVWLVRILDGDDDPPPVGTSRFVDVDASQWWAPYVERLADLAVTTGCATEPARFCPDGTVTRAQMATFLVRAFDLPSGPPGGFADVEGGVHAAHIDALAASGVTSGCYTQPLRYCPRRDTSRGEMATFLTRAAALDSQISVEPLDGPPQRLGLHRFYEKYLDAGGMPIVSGSAVPDEALYAASAIFGEMLSDRPELSAAMAELGVRVVVMARSTVLSDLPEFPTDSFWDGRTRGGGVFADPMVVIAEQNLLCYEDDVYPHEDISVHEFAHALHLVGLERRQADSSFRMRLNNAYDRAIAAGLWNHTYAGTNFLEYWAEGVQSWFGLNDPPGPIHNDINTRDELDVYDPNLAALLGEVFGDASVSSSCHETYTDDRTTAVVQGAVSGPDGQGIKGILIWLWQGTRENSGWGWTDSEGVFTIRVPDGSYRLDVYAAPRGTCAGWYDGDGITTTRSEARRVTVEGTDITDITIRLPAPPQDLLTITC